MVTLIGLGGGSAGGMTAEALAALSEAELIIGAQRVLEAVPESSAERIAEYKPEAILSLIRENENRSVAVLMSGDTGFYSGAAKLCELLRREEIRFKVLPGLSSVQLLAARIGLPWQDWELVSAHGTACDPVREILKGKDVFFLTGGSATPGSLCRELSEAGFGSLKAVVGEELTYPSERVRWGRVSEFAGETFAKLSVLLVFGGKAGNAAGQDMEEGIKGTVPPESAGDASPCAAGTVPETRGKACSSEKAPKKRLMISAMASGSGKTVLTCGFLTALKKRGIDCEAFKCGPDYIDPMFHAKVLGVPSRNLDSFLEGAAGVRRTLGRQRASFAVIEGAMGFYDGAAGTTEASAWEIAASQGIPVVLAVNPRGSSTTLAAQIRGLLEFRKPAMIAGVVLTNCRESLFGHLKPVIERETGLLVLGFIPPMKEAEIESRHLGLLTADEVADFRERFEAVAARMEETVDIERLCGLAGTVRAAEPEAEEADGAGKICRIAVARDEGFSFYYEDSLAALRAAGAELIFFSPIRDAALPECGGLYLGGGYPELYARELEENVPMRESIRKAVCEGLPTVAECGGFLYLGQSLEDQEGVRHAMAGVLPGEGFKTGHLRRFGYAYLVPEKDSLLFRAGEKVPVHEFHYWDSTESGSDLRAEKPDGRTWNCGFASASLYAGFPHLFFGGEAPLAERFAAAAAEWERKR